MKEIDISIEGIYKEDDGVRRAREKAMVYLSYSDHTVRSMYEKLSENGFDKDDIDNVISFLCDRGYINENDYFERFCIHNAEKKGYGRRRIEMMAHAKGFSKKTINDRSDEVFENIDFVDICLGQLKKIKSLDLSDRKSKDKAIASLMRKGFSLSDIRSAIALYLENE
ncbi:MAG: regulatory protein RecX [Clostridia bacterium]|nr:regulatory protein RecX [Clostridia bacterium]